MKTVTGKLLRSDGSPVANSLVRCSLEPTTGWRIITPFEQFSDSNEIYASTVNTDSAGAYSFSLMENDLMEPAGTYYTLHFPDVASEVNIQVLTSSASPSNVRDVLIPGAIPPVGRMGTFVTFPEGDARYAFKGADISAFPIGAYAIYPDVATRDALSPAATTATGTICVTIAEGGLWVVNTIGAGKRWTLNWQSAWGKKFETSSISNTSGIAAGLATVPVGFSGFMSWRIGRAYRIHSSMLLVGHGAITTVVASFLSNKPAITQRVVIEPEQTVLLQFNGTLNWQTANLVNDPVSISLTHTAVAGGVPTIDIRGDLITSGFMIQDNGPFNAYTGP